MGEILYNPDEKQRQGSSFLFCFVFRFCFNVFCQIHLGYTWDIQCSLLFLLHYYYDISHTLPFYIGPTILSSLQVTHDIYIVLFVLSLVSASARHCHKQTIQISFKGPSINDATRFWQILLLPFPHRHTKPDPTSNLTS